MRKAIWTSMLDADMNARYWTYLVRRYTARDTNLKIFMAIMASGTVASWGLWEMVPWLWKSLSSISAVSAILMPILNYQKSIAQMADLAGKWGELRIEYEDLWMQARNKSDSEATEASYKKFRKIESALQEKESNLPEDKKLIKRSFDEVKRARGIE
jgi:hypothetical protein